jgi:hypothetical protein
MHYILNSGLIFLIQKYTNTSLIFSHIKKFDLTHNMTQVNDLIIRNTKLCGKFIIASFTVHSFTNHSRLK